MTRLILNLFLFCFLLIGLAAAAVAQVKPGRDPNQPINEEYTRKIREYTTEPCLN